MNKIDNQGSGESIGGEQFYESQAKEVLTTTIGAGYQAVSSVINAFRSPWKGNPSTIVRAAFGNWIVTSARHLLAILTLATTSDLAMVADVHYRQMLEIWFQVRKLAFTNENERDKTAAKVAAWGALDYLDKLSRFKDTEFGRRGYNDIESQLKTFDTDLVNRIVEERKSSQMFWFGKTVSQLAREVSRDTEDLALLYRIVSAQVHGSWSLAIDVANPEPGKLDFHGYPNKAQLLYWSAEIADRATDILRRTWNEIAQAVDAPKVLTE